MRKRKIIALTVLIILILSTALGIFYYQENVSDKLERLVEKRLRGALGADLEIGSTTVRFLPVTIILKDVVFPKFEDREEWPALSIQEIRMTLSPWSLLTEVLVIKEIILKEPRARIERFDDGRWVWTAPPLRPKTTGLIPTLIRRIEIKGGQLDLFDRPNHLKFLLAQVNGTVEPDLIMQNYEIHFSAENGALTYSTLEEKNLKLEGQLSVSPGRLEIVRTAFFTKDAKVVLHGDLDRLETAPAVRLRADLELSSRPFQKAGWIPQDLRGSARAQTEISGTYPNLKIKGKSLFKELFFQEADLFQGNVDFSLSDRTIVVERLEGKSLGGNLSGKGQWTLQKGAMPFEAAANFQDLSLDAAQPLLPAVSLLTGKHLGGEIEASGQGLSLEKLKAKGRLHAAGPPKALPQETILSKALAQTSEIETLFDISDANLHLTETRLDSDLALLQSEGNIHLKSREMQFNLHLTSQEADKVLKLMGLNKNPSRPTFITFYGPIEFSGQLKGTPQSPLVQGTAHAQQLVMRGHPVGPAIGDILFADRTLTFQNAIVTKSPSSYTFNGEVRFPHQELPQFKVRAAVQQSSLADILDIFYKKLPMDARMNGTFEVEGKPKAFLLSANAELSKGNLYGQPFEEGEARITITPTRISFEQIRIRERQTSLEGSGWISFKGRFSADLSSEAMHSKDIEWLKVLHPHLSAELAAKLKGSGDLRSPEFHGQAKAKTLTIANQLLGEADLRISIVSNDLHLEAVLENRKASLEGLLGLEKTLPVDARLTLTDFPAGGLLRQLNPEFPEDLDLLASGQIQATGQASDPSGLKMDAVFTRLQANLAGYKITNEGDSVLEYIQDLLRIRRLGLKGEGTSLSVTGELKYKNHLDLFINGEADLNVFRLVSQEIAYGKGKAYLVLKITDQWDNPNIQGGITVQEGTLRSQTLGQAITISSMGLFFNQRQIVLENLEGEASGGRLQARGKVDLKNLRPEKFGITANLTNVRITPAEDFTVTFSGDLFAQGDASSKQIRGEFQIQRARYTKRIDLKSWLVEFKERRSRPTEFKPTPFLGESQLDLHFSGANNIRIENNLAKIPLEIDLFIKGTFDRPLIFGHVEAREGEIYFQRNVFKVQSALLDLIGTEQIVPILDLKAETSVRDYQVQMSLTGRLDQPLALNLTSDPPLSETDILALLTIGRTAEELAELPSGAGTGEATAFTTSVLFDEFVEGRVKELTGIDRFQVEPYATSSKAASGPRLTVQKQLLDERLTATYISAVDPAEEEVIQLEYQLDRGISIIGERDENGRLGGDIKFRLEFR